MQESYLRLRARAEKLVSTIVPEKEQPPFEAPHLLRPYVGGATTHKAMEEPSGAPMEGAGNGLSQYVDAGGAGSTSGVG